MATAESETDSVYVYGEDRGKERGVYSLIGPVKMHVFQPPGLVSVNIYTSEGE